MRMPSCIALMSIALLACNPHPGASRSLASGGAGHGRNILIFVADGLRPGMVNDTDTPTMMRLQREGVLFANSHSIFPTFTTANAAAIATGHYPGDTADFSNTIYAGYPIFAGSKVPGETPGTPTPNLENDPVLGDLDVHVHGGSYLDEDSLLAIARGQGYNTAAVGKVGPTLIQDPRQGNPDDAGTVSPPPVYLVDDATGHDGGLPLAQGLLDRLNTTGLAIVATSRQPANARKMS